MKHHISNKLWLSPIIIAIILPAANVACYFSTILGRPTGSKYLFISDVVTVDPEAGYFTLTLILCSGLWMITNRLRYEQLQRQLEKLMLSRDELTRLERINKHCHRLGHLITSGAVILASFRSSEQVILHGIGAMLLLAGSTGHSYAQTYLLYRLSRIDKHSVDRPTTMIIFCVLYTILGSLFVASGFIGHFFLDVREFVHYKHRIGASWNNTENFWFVMYNVIIEWIFINLLSVYLFCVGNRMRRHADILITSQVCHLNSDPLMKQQS